MRRPSSNTFGSSGGRGDERLASAQTSCWSGGVSELPSSWVVQRRASLLDLAFLAFGVFIGLFFSVVLCGGVGGLVWRASQGTLFEGGAPTLTAVVKYVAIGLFGAGFGLVMLRTTVGSLLDLIGLEVVVHGPVEQLKALRGTRGTSYRMVVQGEEIEVPFEVYKTLFVNAPVWARAGRFERGLKVLARPASDVPRR